MTTQSARLMNANPPPDGTAPSRASNGGERQVADFAGAVVAHFESRLADSMDSLIQRHGGRAWSAPALSEVPVDDPNLPAVLADLASGKFDIVALLTGVATRRLFHEAEKAGVTGEVHRALSVATVICRGPKPASVLRQHEIVIRHLVAEPHTTAELLAHLARVPVNGRRVLILSAGERMPEPWGYCDSHGAIATELQLYRWDLSAGSAVRLGETVVAIAGGRIDAAAFTTQVQVRHLFQVASESGDDGILAMCLNERVLTGAVGPTCADALRARGVEPRVVPLHPKMGHLVVEMARLSPRLGNGRNVGG